MDGGKVRSERSNAIAAGGTGTSLNVGEVCPVRSEERSHCAQLVSRKGRLLPRPLRTISSPTRETGSALFLAACNHYATIAIAKNIRSISTRNGKRKSLNSALMDGRSKLTQTILDCPPTVDVPFCVQSQDISARFAQQPHAPTEPGCPGYGFRVNVREATIRIRTIMVAMACSISSISVAGAAQAPRAVEHHHYLRLYRQTHPYIRSPAITRPAKPKPATKPGPSSKP